MPLSQRRNLFPIKWTIANCKALVNSMEYNQPLLTCPLLLYASLKCICHEERDTSQHLLKWQANYDSSLLQLLEKNTACVRGRMHHICVWKTMVRSVTQSVKNVTFENVKKWLHRKPFTTDCLCYARCKDGQQGLIKLVAHTPTVQFKRIMGLHSTLKSVEAMAIWNWKHRDKAQTNINDIDDGKASIGNGGAGSLQNGVPLSPRELAQWCLRMIRSATVGSRT